MYIHVFDGEMIGCTNCEQMTDTYSVGSDVKIHVTYSILLRKSE